MECSVQRNQIRTLRANGMNSRTVAGGQRWKKVPWVRPPAIQLPTKGGAARGQAARATERRWTARHRAMQAVPEVAPFSLHQYSSTFRVSSVKPSR